MLLVVGLGNPGERYAGTRHNIGAHLVELAARRWSIALKPIGPGRAGSGSIDGRQVGLAVPAAWMNQSGPAVATLLRHFALTPSELVVAHDDLDLETGRVRIKQRGGSGGHNGILSIITTLQTDRFTRVKIGIGRPAPGVPAADFVLSRFSRDEWAAMESALARALDAVECLLLEGVAAAMNRYNVRQPD